MLEEGLVKVFEWSSGTEVGTYWSQLMKLGRGDSEPAAFGGSSWIIVACPWWKGFYFRIGKKPPLRPLPLV